MTVVTVRDGAGPPVVVEIPAPPQRGQWLILPGESEPRRIERVIQHARVPVDWTPGWKLAAALEVILDSEDADDLPAPDPTPVSAPRRTALTGGIHGGAVPPIGPT